MENNNIELSLIDLNDQIKQDNFDNLELHMHGLKNMLITEAVKVKEKDFKTYFLPILSGKLELNEKNVNRYIDNMYILTNSYNIPIQIINDYDGLPLFKLPPIVLNVGDNDILKNVSFSKAIKVYKEMSDSSNPYVAQQTLQEITDALGNIIKPSDDELTEYNNDLLFMYDRYGITFKDNKHNKEIKEIKKEIDEVEFDYDD